MASFLAPQPTSSASTNEFYEEKHKSYIAGLAKKVILRPIEDRVLAYLQHFSPHASPPSSLFLMRSPLVLCTPIFNLAVEKVVL